MKDNRNLGKYDIKKVLRNPMLIHRIQDNLQALAGTGMFSDSLRTHSKISPDLCVKMIVEQYADNPKEVTRIVGKETLKLIEEYTGETLANDLKNVNI